MGHCSGEAGPAPQSTGSEVLTLPIMNRYESSGQSFWLQIQRSGFDSRHYQIFREVVGLERGQLRLVNAIEELLEKKKK
jgi:hypothetical protein